MNDQPAAMLDDTFANREESTLITFLYPVYSAAPPLIELLLDNRHNLRMQSLIGSYLSLSNSHLLLASEEIQHGQSHK